MTLSPLSQQQETHVSVDSITWHPEEHAISIGTRNILLTPTEFRLLYPLRHGTAVTYANLAKEAYHYHVDENIRMMMDKHIDRIRGKLRGSGLYIYCVLGYGYLFYPDKVCYFR